MMKINEKAKEILTNSKVLVDIIVESENSRFMNVLKDGTIYFLRFIGNDCYACCTMEECEKLPVSTRYRSENSRYILFGSKVEDTNFIKSNCVQVDKSNLYSYIEKQSKLYCSFYKQMFIWDSLENRVSARITKQQVVINYIRQDLSNYLKAVLGSILREFNLTTIAGSVKLISQGDDLCLVRGSKIININTSRYLCDINFLVEKLQNLTGHNIECILFTASKVLGKSEVTSTYIASTKEPGTVRVCIGIH